MEPRAIHDDVTYRNLPGGGFDPFGGLRYAHRMRALLVMPALLAGCFDLGTSSSGPHAPLPGQGEDGRCQADRDCDSGLAWAPDELRPVHINWTVGGMPASVAACDARQDLEIDFQASAEHAEPHVAFSPVPCSAGRFSVDKLPASLTFVELGARSSLRQSATIDATGEANLDLMF
jgi:hypothetical protein